MNATVMVDAMHIVLRSGSNQSSDWYLDSGASDHFMPHREFYNEDYTSLDAPI